MRHSETESKSKICAQSPGFHSGEKLKRIEKTIADGGQMANPETLAKWYHHVMSTMVETGVAPHYTDLGKKFGHSPAEAREILRELLALRIPCWPHPDTDLIASFAPFNNLPTQYKITVEGQQKWYGQ